MKTDARLQQDVLDELRWEPVTKDAEIGVAVKDGVVTLSGMVRSFAQKLAAERAAERVSGVRALAEELVVKLPTARERSDTEIAHAAVNALSWDIEVPDDKLKVRVENGWVVLEGTVEWQYEKLAAERAVLFLTGVKGVRNDIAVKPAHASPFEVSEKIKAALRRSAELDAAGISVKTLDGSVTLEGNVRSWAERRDAERAAWSAPGVREVRDHLAVTG